MHERQSEHRLFWVAIYHDGTVIDEREAPGEISSEQIDRHGLARFEMVDEFGEPRPLLGTDGKPIDHPHAIDYDSWSEDQVQLEAIRRQLLTPTEQLEHDAEVDEAVEAESDTKKKAALRADRRAAFVADLRGRLAADRARPGLTFPVGADPKLVYRRRSFFQPFGTEPVDPSEWKGPDPDNQADWTYLLGYHHADGALEIWGMGADGLFRPDDEPDIELVDVERF